MVKEAIDDLRDRPANISIYIPAWKTLGVQIGVTTLGPGAGSCLSVGAAAGVGRSVNVGTFGGPVASGSRDRAKDILSGFGGSATAQVNWLVGYQVAYSISGAIGGSSWGVPGFSFSYGYS